MYDKIKILAKKILNPKIEYSVDEKYTLMRVNQQNVDCAKEILKIIEEKQDEIQDS